MKFRIPSITSPEIPTSSSSILAIVSSIKAIIHKNITTKSNAFVHYLKYRFQPYKYIRIEISITITNDRNPSANLNQLSEGNSPQQYMVHSANANDNTISRIYIILH